MFNPLTGKKNRPILFTNMAKTYEIDKVDSRMSFYSKCVNGIQLVVTKPLQEGTGRATVDGKEISHGKIMKIPMSPFPIWILPVGEVATEYEQTYTVKLEGFVDTDGNRMRTKTFHFKTDPRRTQDPKYAAHDSLALEAAREGMVLLKNEDGVLPLQPDACLNLFGAGQNLFRMSSWGAGENNPRWRASLWQAVRDHSSFSFNQELKALYASRQEIVPSPEVLQRAKAQNDTAIIVLSRASGENSDNRPVEGEYYLSAAETEMIRAVCSVFEKTAVILNTGYPIDMRWTKEFKIKAILSTGFSGMLGAYALVEMLDGRTNPSGKLPDTWSWDYFDAPASRNFVNLKAGEEAPAETQKAAKLYYEEDIYVGYRYFDSFRKQVAFSFGHGLSYTHFDLACAAGSYDGEKVCLDVVVTNTGKVSGKEVVQVYVHAPEGKLEKPERVLAAFEKTSLLAPGESQSFHLEIAKKWFASYDPETASWILEKGAYRVDCGNSLETSRPVLSFDQAETEILKVCAHLGAPVEPIDRLTRAKDEVGGGKSGLVEYDRSFGKAGAKKPYARQPLPRYAGKRILFDDLKRDPSRLDDFVAQMSSAELCRLSVCGGANWAPWQDGTGGRIFPLKKYGMPRFIFSDGNSGVNIRKPNIGFPASNTVCATFNREMAYAIGKTIAEESVENGIRVNLGPAMNIHRNILNGRHPEYYSEDPYLAGVMAGWQGKGLEDNGVSCCYKHFCCNNSEVVRKASESVVSERALREIYYRVFECAFAVHKPDTMMTSYNSVNGIYPAENPELLDDLLRGEFGFEGFYMADWFSCDTVDPAGMAAAGNSLVTPGGMNSKSVKPLVEAVKKGALSRGVLEDNVKRILRVMLKRAS